MSWQKTHQITLQQTPLKVAYSEKLVFYLQKYFYKDKQNDIDELFIQYLVPIMEDLDHPVLIEERKQNIDADAHEKNTNKDVELPSIKN